MCLKKLNQSTQNSIFCENRIVFNVETGWTPVAPSYDEDSNDVDNKKEKTAEDFDYERFDRHVFSAKDKNLYRIWLRYGVHYKKIQEVNGLSDTDVYRLSPWTVLKIPKSKSIRQEVQKVKEKKSKKRETIKEKASAEIERLRREYQASHQIPEQEMPVYNEADYNDTPDSEHTFKRPNEKDAPEIIEQELPVIDSKEEVSKVDDSDLPVETDAFGQRTGLLDARNLAIELGESDDTGPILTEHKASISQNRKERNREAIAKYKQKQSETMVAEKPEKEETPKKETQIVSDSKEAVTPEKIDLSRLHSTEKEHVLTLTDIDPVLEDFLWNNEENRGYTFMLKNPKYPNGVRVEHKNNDWRIVANNRHAVILVGENLIYNVVNQAEELAKAEKANANFEKIKKQETAVLQEIFVNETWEGEATITLTAGKEKLSLKDYIDPQEHKGKHFVITNASWDKMVVTSNGADWYKVNESNRGIQYVKIKKGKWAPVKARIYEWVNVISKIESHREFVLSAIRNKFPEIADKLSSGVELGELSGEEFLNIRKSARAGWVGLDKDDLPHLFPKDWRKKQPQTFEERAQAKKAFIHTALRENRYVRKADFYAVLKKESNLEQYRISKENACWDTQLKRWAYAINWHKPQFKNPLWPPINPFNSEANIKRGAKHLNDMIRKYKRDKGIMLYNMWEKGSITNGRNWQTKIMNSWDEILIAQLKWARAYLRDINRIVRKNKKLYARL